ncbi:uncharacterized protein SPPG_05908 [Spizellomyces punctatus DAOM BR117]|uniref:Rgp1-domain-containing protein n=1 Tax=Spizellomyces punctatus (strain DAOM BR117) TaxID=645134 RepID=A0A0L0HDV3_SPIPD|nr:uncharacterized protein SPPG_05908 [Spizellomyces punctatus DAOM BR117]KNC98948.1 hypothetical protein SPPG_05908 [Spizellomyces punctatus DAOM BR117]|eukprot:XP_016606988.1 hypothetical protein SPPG_05908 [Spizellomyces punctatus DAOM BR117]
MVVLLTVNLGDPTNARGSDGIFFSGERFTCSLTFSNVVSSPTSRYGSESTDPKRNESDGEHSQTLTAYSPTTRSPNSSLSETGSDGVHAFSEVPQSHSDTVSSGLEAVKEEGDGGRVNAPRPDTGSRPPPRGAGSGLRLSRPKHVVSRGPLSAGGNGTRNASLESMTFSQLLRKSISLSSLRSAVGSTLGLLGSSAEHDLSQYPQRRGHMQVIRQLQPAEPPRALRTTGAPRAPLPSSLHASPPSSPAPLSPVTIPPQIEVRGANRISLHTVSMHSPSSPGSSTSDLHSAPGTAHVQQRFSSSYGDLTKQYPPLPRNSFDTWHSTRGSAPSPMGSKPESITWAYVQMTGHFSVDPAFIKASAFEALKSKVMYRSAAVTGGGVGGGGTLGISSTTSSPNDRSAETKNLPLYSTPPSILFTDLSLAPGESKTYKYEILLPANLPPSHRGKAIRFSYKLIVGIQRGGIAHRSQVIQLPFRVFSQVHDDGSRPIYEIANPVVINKDEAVVSTETVHHALPPTLLTLDRIDNRRATVRPRSKTKSLLEKDDIVDCMARTINLCQHTKKVSYDICKNNEHVAQLILPRNVYRLGETVMGMLDFSNSSIPCYQLSAFLENNEHIEEPFAVRSNEQSSRLTRRVYAEHHRYSLNTQRAHIELFLPVSCSPEFQTSAVSVQWCLRLEFITGSNTRLHLRASNDVHFAHMHANPTAAVEAFDCVIPLRVYGAKTARTTQSMQLFEIP